MKKKVLIFGSGSVGTHHTNAAISLNCEVFITDKKNSQLINMKEKTYPLRYGHWDNKINCINYKDVFKLKYNFDLIIIGVPPKFHLKIAKLCLKKLKFKKILIEKPLCVFNENYDFLKKKSIRNKVYCGFNHSISKSFGHFLGELKKISKKNEVKIDIEWKESFDLVLKAHPWLKSLNDSYLSNFKLGGGALHEYSHAVHFFLILKEIIFNDKNIKLIIKTNFCKSGKNKYDKKVQLSYQNGSKKINLFLNTINNPPIKKVNVISKNKNILFWTRHLDKNIEVVNSRTKMLKKINFKISRREDFINELKILLSKNNDNKNYKYLKLEYAAKVMVLLRKIYIQNV